MTSFVSSLLRRLPRLALDSVEAVNAQFNRNFLAPGRGFEYQLIGAAMLPRQNEETSPTSVFEEAILRMAVPKSKISPSRKRMKWQQHIPDRIDWVVCTRCGEPKRPHRICTAHMDICAMREEDYKVHIANKEKNPSS